MRSTDEMPRSTQRAHFEPSWRGDGPNGLHAVANDAKGPDGIRAIDCNFQVARVSLLTWLLGFRIFCMHWETPRANNYRYIVGPGPTGRVRPMTQAELDRPIWQWKAGQVKRWRRTNNRNGTRPWTYAQMVALAHELDVYICAEVKSGYFTRPAVARQAVRTAKKTGHPPWFMALFNMDAEHKCPAIRNAGGDFAVIFGSLQKLRPEFHRERGRWARQPTREW